MRVRIHQPLWGGFPMHWASGPIESLEWTPKEADASGYSEKEAKFIEKRARKDFPSAVVHVS